MKTTTKKPFYHSGSSFDSFLGARHRSWREAGFLFLLLLSLRM
jgi:hypothetical protein